MSETYGQLYNFITAKGNSCTVENEFPFGDSNYISFGKKKKFVLTADSNEPENQQAGPFSETNFELCLFGKFKLDYSAENLVTRSQVNKKAWRIAKYPWLVFPIVLLLKVS